MMFRTRRALGVRGRVASRADDVQFRREGRLAHARSWCNTLRLMDDFHCSFCGKRRREVRKLISGPRVFICDECVALCNDIIAKEEAAERPKYPAPARDLDELDRYVIGQDRAKKALSVAVYNHYKRIGQRGKAGEVEIQKGNILLLGPTGCGKTLLAQTLAKKLDVPFAIADATTLTEAGYVGEDVDSVIKALYRNAGDDVEKASARHRLHRRDRQDRAQGRRPVGRRATSRAKACSRRCSRSSRASSATITPDGARNRPQQELIQVDTTDILFVCTRRLQRPRGDRPPPRRPARPRLRRRSIGKGEETRTRCARMARTEDLIKFGMIPEFMGRLPIIVACDDARRRRAGRDPVEAEERARQAVPAAVRAWRASSCASPRTRCSGVAEEAARRKSGARGLRAILEEVMLDVMYEIPSLTGVSECVVTRDVVVSRGRPQLVREKKAS